MGKGGRKRTFLELLKALEGDLKLVGVSEGGWIVQDLDAEKRDDRHLVFSVLGDLADCNAVMLDKQQGDRAGDCESTICLIET